MEIGGAQINVRERTLKVIWDDEEVVFKVYNPLNSSSHYKDLSMIMAMEVDECGVVECKTIVTSSNYLIEFPKQPLKLKVKQLTKELEKVVVERYIDLESTHSRC